jgi:2-iminobutanoate/2-iminopropanoate deaminase
MITCMFKIKLAPRLILATLLVAAMIYAAGSKKKVVAPKGAAPSPNFSSGIQVGDTLYVSGMTGTKDGKIPDSFEDEVRQTLSNIHNTLEAGGMDYSDVVAVTVYLTDMDLFQRMNAVYTTIFKEPRPTRTTIGVTRLAGAGAHIEITVTARK